MTTPLGDDLKLGLIMTNLSTKLKCLRSPTMKTRKATQNVEISIVLGGQGSHKVTVGNIIIQ